MKQNTHTHTHTHTDTVQGSNLCSLELHSKGYARPLVPLKNPESQEKGERKTRVEVKGRQEKRGMDGGGWYNTTSNYSNFKNKAKIYTLKDDQRV